MAANSMNEINSFLTKFSSLWKAGRDACLQIETHAGQACVTLRLGLGEYPGHQHKSEQKNGQNFNCEGSPSHAQKKLSPSKMRRRARRAAARLSTAESAVGKDTSDKENDAAAQSQESSKEVVSSNDSSLSQQYACDQCDFISSWVNGLNIHVSVMHEICLGPLDVPKTKEDREVHDLAQNYWKSGILANNLQVYIKALVDVEKANVDDHTREIEENKLEQLWKKMQGVQGSKIDYFPP